MASSGQVVQGVEYDIEGLEPTHVELAIHDVCMISLQFCAGLEIMRNFFRNLRVIISVSDYQSVVSIGHSAQSGRSCCGKEGREQRTAEGDVTRRTRAFGFLICSCRKRNCRFRLLRSIVSRSIMWTSPKPVRTRFFSSSQPMPPAPTRSTRD